MQSAEQYAELRDLARVHERALFPTQRIPSELELQARWFAGHFGRQFQTVSGQNVEIVQFGIWNHAAGPDFSDAVLQFDGGEPIRGAIEFDLADRSWETHGHATNPAFNNAILHVFVHQSDRTFFTRTESNRNVPQVRVNLDDLPDSFSANVPPAKPGRCSAPLRGLPEDRLRRILTAAAQFRLQRKAARLRNTIKNHGRDEALFQEIAAALGYTENKLPFTLLAQRLPLRFLRKQNGRGEAVLFGVAGFLDTPDIGAYDGAARDFIKGLWNGWWPHRDGMQRLVLPRTVWRFTGTRPLNHPQRRLGALAILVKAWPSLIRSLARRNPRHTHDFFITLEHPFWNRHCTLRSDPTPTNMAPIGESRVADIVANVLLPYFFLAQGLDLWPAYEELPARLTNRRLETGAARLFGDDPRRGRFTRTVAHQQGLLQIYEDFCLQDNSDCAHCPFPEQMRNWQ